MSCPQWTRHSVIFLNVPKTLILSHPSPKQGHTPGKLKKGDWCLCSWLCDPLNCFCRNEVMGGLGTRNSGDWVIEKENYKTQNVFLGMHGHSPGKKMNILRKINSYCSQQHQLFMKSWWRKGGQAKRSVNRTIPVSKLIGCSIYLEAVHYLILFNLRSQRLA